MVSCSAAAARKVSLAAISTDFPSADRRLANLPMKVVFPEPFTPATSTTVGGVGENLSDRSIPARLRLKSSLRYS